ncbi:hypothetical protein H5410_027966, partial [Solanum commersonii]
MSLKSSEPVTSLSMEGVNLDTQRFTEVVCIKGPFINTTRPKLLSSKNLSLLSPPSSSRRADKLRKMLFFEELRKRKMAQNIQVLLKKAFTEDH